ncbi:hypothetical protein OAX78_02325 [Planctomycetota bacterium]|nr:hypothetical protein [Planctomycetota bacterium]
MAGIVILAAKKVLEVVEKDEDAHYRKVLSDTKEGKELRAATISYSSSSTSSPRGKMGI